MAPEAKSTKTMTCGDCDMTCQRFGKHRNGLSRFRCPVCKRTYTESHVLTLGEMYAPKDKVLLALQLLLEGNSIRSTMRITGLDQNTISKALVLAGEKAERIMARKIVNVPVRDVEADEVWSFIGKKEKRVRPEDDQNLGDCYTFVAIERHSKLVLNIAMGKRDQATTDQFIEGVRHATAHSRFRSPLTDSPRIVPQSPPRYMTAATSPNSSRFTARRKTARSATAPPKSLQWRWSQLWVTPILSAFALRLWSGPISAFVWAFGVLRAYQRLCQNGRITGPRSACGMPFTISAGFTNRSALRPRWTLVSPITFGASGTTELNPFILKARNISLDGSPYSFGSSP